MTRKLAQIAFYLSAAVFNLCSGQLFGEQGCPDPEVIKPCVCRTIPWTVLNCPNLTDTQVLENAFANSKEYTYREVYIMYSTLQYLPKSMFDEVGVTILTLKNVTLLRIFDEPPQSLNRLEEIYIENSQILRGMSWNLFEPLTNLQSMTILYNSIKVLTMDFSESVSHNIEKILFFETGTRQIKPGVFKEFTKLDTLGISNCKLTELDREMFPTPFNARVLYFNDNNLQTIPTDLFTQMPKLLTVGLRNNHLSTLPESAFVGSPLLDYVWLEDNPLKCDCQLRWLIHKKMRNLFGSCAKPKWLHGKDLDSLKLTDLEC